jgi:TDG/mug DNA glycosylase family protein
VEADREDGGYPGNARVKRLNDRVRPPVRVLFVGINPGIRSATIGHHFAGYSNRFWTLLFHSGLLPERIRPEDDVRLPEWGYGITNLIARPTPGIDALRPDEYAAGLRVLRRKVRRWRPRIVAFVGVTLFRAVFESRRSAAKLGDSRRNATKAGGSRRNAAKAAGSRRSAAKAGESGRGPAGANERRPGAPVALGLQPELLEGARVFVLPNPSGRNANYSYARMLAAFADLRRYEVAQASSPLSRTIIQEPSGCS